MENTASGQPPLETETASEHSLAHSCPSPETDENSKTMTEQKRYLETLHTPSDATECEYLGLEHLQGVMDQAYSSQSPYVVVKNLPPKEFERHQESFLGQVDYHTKLQILILTMPYAPREVAARTFDIIVRDKARDSDVQRILANRGSTRTKCDDRRKQADCSWIPKHLPSGRSRDWPSVALEAAYSESREKTKKDMEFWLNQSDDVRMAISIDVKRSSGTIFLTSWKRGKPVPPRTAANPEPEAVQEVKIEHGKDGRGPTVTGDKDFTIPFEDIMLRSPAGHDENDFVFTDEDLTEIAEGVWDEMDNK